MITSAKHIILKKFAIKQLVVFTLLCFMSFYSLAQVSTKLDTTKIKIGEQLTYGIKVITDTSAVVVFPEGQTFMPLEMVEASKIDTTKIENKYELNRRYFLTQFDSGVYIIPRQKVIISEKAFYTDSLKVEVNTIKVDTTKQGLYDVKPIIEVQKSTSNWLQYLLLTILIIGLIGLALYWFIWRKKPLSEEEEIALLPPYDRAKLALKKLEDSQYLIRSEIKEYYSELSLIIRKYLDEQVYDHAMESTTDELISRLLVLKDGNQIPLKKETINNIETILKRADLVKFAKSAPDHALAELDKKTVDKEIDSVKESLPEPSEEEKLRDQQYKEEQEAKKKRRKIILTIAISVFLLIATFVGFGIKYGFTYVKDTIIGNESKELLEGDWVNSAYGYPPIYISTPKVLKRTDLPISQEANTKSTTTAFSYGSLTELFSVSASTTTFNLEQQPEQNRENNNETNKIDLGQMSEIFIKQLEQQGVTDILVKREQFITPNAAEGLKTFGTCKITLPNTNNSERANYILLQFTTENILQQIVITSPEDDEYASKIVDRILNSIELKPSAQE